MKTFTLIVGITSLLIAGCAAYFSVRGIGLLFSGFMIPVMVMAASLELGKLVTASFLYRRWSHIALFMRLYLITAVVALILITSLGIYGYLSDAFTKTNTKVKLYEANIVQIESKNKYLQEQIAGITNASSTVDEKANDAILNFQNIYDSFVVLQEKRKESIMSRLASLDAERNKLEASSGGLFSSKKKKILDLAEAQSEERASIRSTLVQIDADLKEEYDAFLIKVDSLRKKTGEVDLVSQQEDVNKYYAAIKVNEEEILNIKELIGDTDIGSFKFIASTFDMELEVVVKWFMVIIVVVFDPLAVCLVIGYNSLLTPTKKTDFVATEESLDSELMTPPKTNTPKIYEEYAGDVTREEVEMAAKLGPSPSNAISPEEIRSLRKYKKTERDFLSPDNLNT